MKTKPLNKKKVMAALNRMKPERMAHDWCIQDERGRLCVAAALTHGRCVMKKRFQSEYMSIRMPDLWEVTMPKKFGGDYSVYLGMSIRYEKAPTAAEGLKAVKKYVRGLK